MTTFHYIHIYGNSAYMRDSETPTYMRDSKTEMENEIHMTF